MVVGEVGMLRFEVGQAGGQVIALLAQLKHCRLRLCQLASNVVALACSTESS